MQKSCTTAITAENVLLQFFVEAVVPQTASQQKNNTHSHHNIGSMATPIHQRQGQHKRLPCQDTQKTWISLPIAAAAAAAAPKRSQALKTRGDTLLRVVAAQHQLAGQHTMLWCQ
jgi:hypothetical protein